jgi:hypothetical protein
MLKRRDNYLSYRTTSKRASIPFRAGNKLARGYRRATSSLRGLPNFILIGAPRCGTTSLYEHLSMHADVIPAFRKEIHFFDVHYDRGVGWYRAYFPLISRLRTKMITGEATPNYLSDRRVPSRIRDTVPDVKLVVLLRNPVDRAYSAWQLKVSEGVEPLSFADAIENEDDRVAADISRFGSIEGAGGRALRYAYLGKGRYSEHLERWLGIFPKEQILVCKSEDIFAGDRGILLKLYSFLGVTSSAIPLPRINVSANDRPLDPAMRRLLADYFVPHNQRLHALLGSDFDWS